MQSLRGLLLYHCANIVPILALSLYGYRESVWLNGLKFVCLGVGFAFPPFISGGPPAPSFIREFRRVGLAAMGGIPQAPPVGLGMLRHRYLPSICAV